MRIIFVKKYFMDMFHHICLTHTPQCLFQDLSSSDSLQQQFPSLLVQYPSPLVSCPFLGVGHGQVSLDLPWAAGVDQHA